MRARVIHSYASVAVRNPRREAKVNDRYINNCSNEGIGKENGGILDLGSTSSTADTVRASHDERASPSTASGSKPGMCRLIIASTR